MSSSATSSSSSDSSSDEGSRPTTNLKRKRDAADDSSSSDDSASEPASDAEEVEVLSHAAQRKRKKELAKAAAKGDAQPDSSGTKAVTKGSVKPATDVLAKRQNSIWVGNLSFKTTPASLKAFFDGVGEITRVHMPMKLPTSGGDPAEGKRRLDNRGFAYVDFASADAKQVAIAMSEQELDGRKLLIKDGDDFTGRPAPPVAPANGATAGSGDAASKSVTHSKTAQKILASQKQPPAPCLFFGNLGFETTVESIKGLLDAHAQPPPKIDQDAPANPEGSEDTLAKTGAGIRKVRMGTFEDSGLCKGFAFVDFHTTEQATAALIQPRNHHLDGRKLVVEYASADAVRRGGGGGPRRLRENSGSKSGKRAAAADGQGPAKRARVDAGEDAEMQDDASAAPQKRSGKARPGKSERMLAKGLVAPAAAAGGAAHGKAKSQRRANPGAALADAPRASAAIVPSKAQKIVF
ncbi:hypothetical protein AURDEDRAFT_80002 [Auricularia subglabra TFB-10046 SS5]|nr:hypothetical protein AURDEDRAFT_80002 [Auricularia subglabra TFB-10046 SS5]